MSEAAAEEVMDTSVLSEEEVEEHKQSSEGGEARQSHSETAAGGDVIPGKRVKKMVERLDLQAPKQREKLRVGDGSGEKLGEIPRTNYQITKMKPADLKPLHTVLFDRPGKMASIKKNLRLFNGFSFDSDSEQFNKKRDKMLKSSNFTNSKLKAMCSVLDLEKKGTHSDLVDRILTFLTSPKSSGKRLLVKKKKKSKKKLSGDDSTSQTKKKTKNKPKASSSSSPKKAKAGNKSKSKAIVMDSSSDEDQDEEEEEEEAEVLAEEKPSEREENSSEEEEEEESEEEASKSKSGRTSNVQKKQPGKRPRAAGKKSSAPRKRSRKSSDQSSSSSSSKSSSQSESDSQQQEKKKKKPLAKTKKADSSSNSKNTHTAEDSSDEDEPLIKMIKKAPSDEQLKETLQNLLKEADLEEMTMKQICQRVFDLYPEHDLSSRKDFIKQTVKALLT